MTCKIYKVRKYSLEVCIHDNGVCTIHHEDDYNYIALYRGYYDESFINKLLDMIAYGLEIEADSEGT